MNSVEYLSGFFDGEGCITTSNGQWEVSCTQTEKNGIEALRSMQERWGGSLYRTKARLKHHSPAWRWKTRGIEAAIALSDMFMFLTVKQHKATEAIVEMRKKPRVRLILDRLSEPKNYFTP